METSERLVLYQSALQDIRDLKANQWRFSHYGLLIQTALVAANTILDAPPIICVLSVVTWLVTVFLIHEAQARISKWRLAVDSLRIEINETNKEWVEKHGPKRVKCEGYRRDSLKYWKRDRPFALLFAFVQTVAMVLAIWAMWVESLPTAS
jgi:hypothetical protein